MKEHEHTANDEPAARSMRQCSPRIDAGHHVPDGAVLSGGVHRLKNQQHRNVVKHPSATELDHDFLWRTTRSLPERGRIGIFNRSYYEEVLIVRVHPEILRSQRLPDQRRISITHVFTQRPRLRQLLVCVVALATLMGGTGPAAAQIYEWVDDANVRHFVTSLESVPPEARSKARIVVEGAESTPNDGVSSSNAGTPSVADATKGVTPTTRTEKETATTFATGWDVGFRAGWNAGFQAATDRQPICPVEPSAVVLDSRPPVVLNVPPYDPAGVYYRSPYEGSMTVPFDAGRSRGLTRRQLEEQRR